MYHIHQKIPWTEIHHPQEIPGLCPLNNNPDTETPHRNHQHIRLDKWKRSQHHPKHLHYPSEFTDNRRPQHTAQQLVCRGIRLRNRPHLQFLKPDQVSNRTDGKIQPTTREPTRNGNTFPKIGNRVSIVDLTLTRNMGRSMTSSWNFDPKGEETQTMLLRIRHGTGCHLLSSQEGSTPTTTGKPSSKRSKR